MARNKESIYCKGCGVWFTPKWKSNKYCTRLCAKSGKNNPMWKGIDWDNKMGITLICESCNLSFTPKFIKGGVRQKYCSQKCSKMGKLNPNYKENVGYNGIHIRMHKKMLRPSMCSHCGISCKPDLANISGLYKEEISDWVWLCRKCHMEMDGITERLIKEAKSRRKYGEIICQQCAKSFTQLHKEQKFCSKSCSITHTNKNYRVYQKGVQGCLPGNRLKS